METRRLRILVVDDERLSRWAAQQILAGRGHEVEEAGCGETALAKVQAWNPDAVILDVGLPGMDGIELLARIRRQRPVVRGIVMTAHATLQSAVAALRAGAIDYLTKPLDPAELESALGRVRMRRAEARGLSA